jgi:hypothetical protein
LSPLVLNPHYGYEGGIETITPIEDVLAIQWTHWEDAVNIYGRDGNGFARSIVALTPTVMKLPLVTMSGAESWMTAPKVVVRKYSSFTRHRESSRATELKVVCSSVHCNP